MELLLLRYGVELESRNLADYLVSATFGKDITKAGTMLEVLLRHGADINSQRSDGQTCLSLLVSLKKFHGMKLAIKRGAKYPPVLVQDIFCLARQTLVA